MRPAQENPVVSEPRRAVTIIPLLVASATFLVFYGALRGQFLNWDDQVNFLQNPHYRGLGWTQIRWMFTRSLDMGHYMPLTWLTLGLDFKLWGLNPFGYHLTGVLLHCANAAIFFLVARRLFAAAAPATAAASGAEFDFPAAVAALFFSVHPLRVESVAWVTERRDVLSGFFYLLAVLCYLRAAACAETRKSSRGRLLSAFFFGCSLLSKISGITLPLTLALLDLYPLGRLSANSRLWLAPDARRIWREKIPFLILALPVAWLGIVAQRRIGVLPPLGKWGAAERLSSALFGASFYVWKTIAPLGLSPYYPFPREMHPLAAPFLFSGLFAAALTAAAFAARRRWPAVLAVWSSYLIALLPVSGIVRNGSQIAADRYTYIPCLGFALLAAGAAASFRKENGFRGTRSAAALAAVLLGALACLTWRETKAWRDTESLWKHALSEDGGNAVALDGMGEVLAGEGKDGEAIRYYESALLRNPDYAEAHNDLGLALARTRKKDEAIREYSLAVKADPGLAEAHNNLGADLAARGKAEDAVREFNLALQFRPEGAHAAHAHDNLGRVYASQGKMEEAFAQFRRAVEADPNLAEAHNDWGLVLAEQGKRDDALRQFDLALQARPEYAEALSNREALGKSGPTSAGGGGPERGALAANPTDAEGHNNRGYALAQQGKADAAVREFNLALQARPGYPDAHNNLGLVLAGQEKIEEAVRHYELALKAQPDFAEAHYNLGLALAAQGKTDAAISQYELAIKTNPNYAEAHSSLGIALGGQGDLGGAISHFTSAIAAKPDLAEAHANLGLALVRQGKTDEAIAQLREALRLNPGFAPARDLLEKLEKSKNVVR
ncbi:MAG: tetratricopeptide repeat protein [Elusimicrobiota bacterium]